MMIVTNFNDMSIEELEAICDRLHMELSINDGKIVEAEK